MPLYTLTYRPMSLRCLTLGSGALSGSEATGQREQSDACILDEDLCYEGFFRNQAHMVTDSL